MNISIQSFKVFVKEEYLYDRDTEKIGLFKEGTVIGVSTYEKCPITFHVMIEDKYLYSDLPIESLVHTKDASVIDNTKDLYYAQCNRTEIEAFTFHAFVNKTISVLLKASMNWRTGKYLMSFDFTTDNMSLHLVKLDNGNFALVPNHKINWQGFYILSDFKKNHIDNCI